MLHKIVFPEVIFRGLSVPNSPDGALVDIAPRVELINLVSTVPPRGQQGFTIADIRERSRLIGHLEDAGDFVVLDQPEYDLLQSVMEISKWTSAGTDSAALRLADAIDAAEEIDPVEAVREESRE